MQHFAHQRGDRQFDAEAFGQAHHFVGGLHRLDHLADGGHRFGDRLAAAQGQAQAAVARKIARAGKHQVAQAGQAHQGFGLAADGDVEPQHFVQAAGDQAGAGIEAQRHAVGDAGGDRQHVFHRAAEFGAEHVVAGVGAESGAVQRFGHVLGKAFVVRMHGDRGRQALRHFLGEGRAGDHGQRHARTQGFAGDFMQETPGAGLETLGGPGHAGVLAPVRRQRAQGLGEGVAGRHHQHEVGAGDGGGDVGAGLQRFRQGDARQVTRVFMRARDGLDLGGVAPPDRGRVPVAGNQRSERRAPGTTPEHGERRLGRVHRRVRLQALPASGAWAPWPCSARRRRPSAYSASKLIGCR